LDVTKAHISPKISIIIPAYNEDGILPTVLSEIFRLNLDTEVIVVDAGSVDGTPQIAKELGIEVIERKIGLG